MCRDGFRQECAEPGCTTPVFCRDEPRMCPDHDPFADFSLPTSPPPPPQRRLHLTIDLHADDLDSIYSALQSIATDLDHDGREERDWMSGGVHDGFRLTLTVTDPYMTAEAYAERLKAWSDERRAARGAV